MLAIYFMFFFFNDTATTEIYTLSLHDALPIFKALNMQNKSVLYPDITCTNPVNAAVYAGYKVVFSEDRKSTRLNSSHANISYAVFCLKKKKNNRSEEYYSELQAHEYLLHTLHH